MALSPEVQSVLDKVRSTATLVGSVDAGVGAMRLQIADLINKLNAPPVVAALSEEDHAALVETADDLDAMAVTLQKDIPTSVPIAPAAAAPAAAPVVPATQEEDSAAASAATPLAGTAPPADAAPAPDAPPAAPAA